MSRSQEPQQSVYFFITSLTALGVVFGDIGTSPLYTIRECFHGSHGIPLSEGNILGVLSLIFWALLLVVSLKYLTVVLRADNRGEGGVLALMALANPGRKMAKLSQRGAIAIGLFGAALLYGDGIITPAISVLSAVEGLKVATWLFEPYIVPISLTILVGLFWLQRYGTSAIGIAFGPIIFVWFSVLGLLGFVSIIKSPEVLAAMNPVHAVNYFLENGLHGFPILSSVFLALTGAEALYADMGHFGRKPIKFAWITVALPGLLLNYFGQGALLLRDKDAIQNPFYLLAPDWALLPMVGLATLAAVVASQAMISGAFSLTRQAVQLGYLPRLVIRHTSSDEIGQIYVPTVNWIMLAATIWLVTTFQSSSNLASAYGIAVSLTMVITTILAFIVARNFWKMSAWTAVPLFGFFLILDLAFFSANFLKVFHGGYVPLVIGAFIFILMTTWKKGRDLLADRLRQVLMTPERFIKQIVPTFPHRLPGTAIFMARNANLIPAALFHNVKHNQVLHETVVLLSVRTEEIPHVPLPGRVEVEELDSGFWSVVIHYGFMDTPNVPEALKLCQPSGLKLDSRTTTYFLSRETLIATAIPGMSIWRENLFGFMNRNAERAANFFKIPSNQLVEIGIQIDL